LSGSLAGPEPLSETHRTAEFACGRPELDNWIREHALEAQNAHTARVFVIHEHNVVVGYYAIVAASVTRQDLPRRQRWPSVPRHEIPCALIARLAVHQNWQGHHLGAALLKDALGRAVSAAESIGVRAVLVHAKDEEAGRFYEYHDFQQSPTDPLHLFLPIQDIIDSMLRPG
jgi:GNAT superfamily N-acetyltransferase